MNRVIILLYSVTAAIISLASVFLVFNTIKS